MFASRTARIVATLALALALPALAQTAGRTAQDRGYLVGGVGSEERDTMQLDRLAYNLFVEVAARTGEFVADVRVRIVDAAGATVLDTTLDGPWLLVDLRSGDYRVFAESRGERIERAVRIDAQGRRELRLRFAPADQGAPVGPSGRAASRAIASSTASLCPTSRCPPSSKPRSSAPAMRAAT
jgi:hypothetical protein